MLSGDPLPGGFCLVEAPRGLVRQGAASYVKSLSVTVRCGKGQFVTSLCAGGSSGACGKFLFVTER